MNFKEQIAQDFDSVFLNTDEFARVCDWNGHSLRIVEDAGFGKEGYEAQGVSACHKKIFCKDSDLSPRPVITEHIMLDCESWYVSDVQPSFGYLAITLDRRVA
jgi:hypothetical protein